MMLISHPLTTLNNLNPSKGLFLFLIVQSCLLPKGGLYIYLRKLLFICMCLSWDMPSCTLLTAPHSSRELNDLMLCTQPVCGFVELTSCVSEARQKLAHQWLWWASDPYGQRIIDQVASAFHEPHPQFNWLIQSKLNNNGDLFCKSGTSL